MYSNQNHPNKLLGERNNLPNTFYLMQSEPEPSHKSGYNIKLSRSRVTYALCAYFLFLFACRKPYNTATHTYHISISQWTFRRLQTVNQ